MEKIMKGYIFRLYPNDKQKELIEKSFGCSRYIYNYFLSKSNGYINTFNSCKEIKELSKENSWLKEVDGCLLRCSIFNLENGFKRYKNKLGEYPKFKSKNKSRLSYRTNNVTRTYYGHNYNSIEIDLERKIIKLPKLKEVRIRGYRNLKRIDGRIINATIYKESNKYYVSICVETIVEIPYIIPSKIVGIDLGIKDLVITSDGLTIENKHTIEKYEKKIKGLNRWLARCKVGSKNRYKVKLKLQEVYRKLRNARKYLIHSISNELVNDNDVIVTESLKINKLVQNKQLSKKIYDASWYELIRQLEYKTKWKGKELYKIETYYPSSQICSRCGYQDKRIKDLRIREWECQKCTNNNKRDINASINIMFEGIKLYMKNRLNELQSI